MEDRQEFIDAAKEQAFTYEGEGIIHSQAGIFGADWKLDSVVRNIESAVKVSWDGQSFTGHQLVTEGSDGCIIHFAVQKPSR